RPRGDHPVQACRHLGCARPRSCRYLPSGRPAPLPPGRLPYRPARVLPGPRVAFGLHAPPQSDADRRLLPCVCAPPRSCCSRGSPAHYPPATPPDRPGRVAVHRLHACRSTEGNSPLARRAPASTPCPHAAPGYICGNPAPSRPPHVVVPSRSTVLLV